MTNKHLIDLAYDVAKEQFKKDEFSFDELWKSLVKKTKLNATEQTFIGDLYTDILQDVRFIFAGNKKWKLREFLTQEQILSLENSLYDFANDEKNGSEVEKAEDYIDKDFEINEEDEEQEDEAKKKFISESSLVDEESDEFDSFDK